MWYFHVNCLCEGKWNLAEISILIVEIWVYYRFIVLLLESVINDLWLRSETQLRVLSSWFMCITVNHHSCVFCKNSVMGKLMVECFLLGVLVQAIAVYSLRAKQVNIWPMPKSVVYGNESLYLSKDFELKTKGTKYPDASGILKDGFSRLLAVINTAHVIDANFSRFDPSTILHGIHVVVLSQNDEVLVLSCLSFWY